MLELRFETLGLLGMLCNRINAFFCKIQENMRRPRGRVNNKNLLELLYVLLGVFKSDNY
jgi:hypothetical protein